MNSELLINVTSYESRVALVENGRLREIYIERPDERGLSGNIYKGRVSRVLPGMQAAFVDIGLERSAFLYAGDAITDYDALEYARWRGNGSGAPGGEGPPVAAGEQPVQELLRPGQEVLVQVAKEPVGTKGARVTSQVSLPGRYLVYMPFTDHLGVSRRIESDAERERLRESVQRLRPGHGGYILRTAAEGASEEDLAADIAFLGKLWERVLHRWEKNSVPTVIHEELSVSLRAVRDMLTPGIEAVIVDDAGEYERIKEFVEAFEPDLLGRVRLYRRPEPLFDRRGIEVSIQRLLSTKVWLPSGGYLVIDSAEALTAIDVNTGRYVGKQDFEETALKTNLEAVEEIADQVRLRNIGGIVVIDFIDMQRVSSREAVQKALVEAVKRDKARTGISPMSALGIVEMTRKRIREPVLRTLAEDCPYCDGSGLVLQAVSVAHEILRQLVREVNAGPVGPLEVLAHPEVVRRLREEDHDGLVEIEERMGAPVRLASDESFHRERFEIRVVP